MTPKKPRIKAKRETRWYRHRRTGALISVRVPDDPMIAALAHSATVRDYAPCHHPKKQVKR